MRLGTRVLLTLLRAFRCAGHGQTFIKQTFAQSSHSELSELVAQKRLETFRCGCSLRLKSRAYRRCSINEVMSTTPPLKKVPGRVTRRCGRGGPV